MFLEVYAVIILLVWLGVTVWLLVNSNKIEYLSALPVHEHFDYPSVAIIVAVRDEEYGLKAALTSVCNLDYPAYDIIVVNDRSTDGTATILSEVQAVHPNVQVITVDTLPGGWLGKNHALYKGYKAAKADYLLFTDADVVYDKTVLKKALGYALLHQLEHLTILPGIISKSGILSSVLMTFVIMLTSVQRPWAVRNQRSKASMGVGAFNLVKTTAYEKAGTHEAIKMRPDDDLKLGALLKTFGGKADVLYGIVMLSVEWYSSVKEFINGLMKNVFSGFNYNVLKAFGGALGTLVVFVLPLPLMLLPGNVFSMSCGLLLLLCQLVLYYKMPGTESKWWYGLLSVYGGFIMLYVVIKATIKTLKDGGIYWRGTFYGLRALRK